MPSLKPYTLRATSPWGSDTSHWLSHVLGGPVKRQPPAGSCPPIPAAWPVIPKLPPSATPLKAPEKH